MQLASQKHILVWLHDIQAANVTLIGRLLTGCFQFWVKDLWIRYIIGCAINQHWLFMVIAAASPVKYIDSFFLLCLLVLMAFRPVKLYKIIVCFKNKMSTINRLWMCSLVFLGREYGRKQIKPFTKYVKEGTYVNYVHHCSSEENVTWLRTII